MWAHSPRPFDTLRRRVIRRWTTSVLHSSLKNASTLHNCRVVERKFTPGKGNVQYGINTSKYRIKSKKYKHLKTPPVAPTENLPFSIFRQACLTADVYASQLCTLPQVTNVAISLLVHLPIRRSTKSVKRPQCVSAHVPYYIPCLVHRPGSWVP